MQANESGISSKPSRLEGFAKYFKRYMGVSSLVTAVLPIPITALGVIPTYKFQTKILSTYTSLFCFLILAFIFYSRHQLARAMFPEQFQRMTSSRLAKSWRLAARALVRLLPLVLVVGSIASAFKYQQLLVNSIVQKREKFDLPDVPDVNILTLAWESQTPESHWLMVYYLAIFMMAEAAFVIMAIKEHLQDTATLKEMDLIAGPPTIKTDHKSVDQAGDVVT